MHCQLKNQQAWLCRHWVLCLWILLFWSKISHWEGGCRQLGSISNPLPCPACPPALTSDFQLGLYKNTVNPTFAGRNGVLFIHSPPPLRGVWEAFRRHLDSNCAFKGTDRVVALNVWPCGAVSRGFPPKPKSHSHRELMDSPSL